MSSSARSITSVVLLGALLAGATANGIILAHVASDHPPHARAVPQDDGHPPGVGHAAPTPDHTADHVPDHAHEITGPAATAPARIAVPTAPVQPLVAQARAAHAILPDGHPRTSPWWALLRAGPPEPRRHAILLL